MSEFTTILHRWETHFDYMIVQSSSRATSAEEILLYPFPAALKTTWNYLESEY